MWVHHVAPVFMALLLMTAIPGHSTETTQHVRWAGRDLRQTTYPEFNASDFPRDFVGALAASEPSCNVGCFADTFASRALYRFLYKDNQTLTVEDCHGAAILKNYSVYALQYGRECWGGKGLARATQYGLTRDCNMTCPGNSSQLCGGWLTFNLYFRGNCRPPPSPAPPPPSPSPPPPSPSPPPPSPPPPSPPPPSPPPPSPHSGATCYLGCYADSFAARAMYTELYHDSRGMSVEACQAAAIKKKYSLFGVTNAEECWGSNMIYQAVSHGLSSSCSMPCPGNNTEMCGGSLAINLYALGACTPPAPPNTSPSPPPNPSPPLPPPPEPTCQLGCYADSFDLRAATYLYQQGRTMSVETCRAAATQHGYGYYALEYGRECWATNDATSLLQYGPSTQCNMTCPGNAADMCGGWLAMNVHARGRLCV